MWKLPFALGISVLIIACTTGTERDSAPGEPNTDEISQGLTNLGSSIGANLVAQNTCGLNNGVTPSCDTSSASDISYTWTAPKTKTYTFSTAGSDFTNILQIAPFATPTSPLGCASNRTSTASLDLSLTAGQQVIVTIDGYAALCGNSSLSIKYNCGACNTPPSCHTGPGTCSQTTGTCMYQPQCGSDELCLGGKCVQRCTVQPNFPC